MTRSDSGPFDLLRYFTGASFAVVLATTLGAGIASALLARAVFAEMERDDAANVGEYFVTELAQDGFTHDVWGRKELPPTARARALSDMRNFDLSELKLLDCDGRESITLLSPGQTASARWPDGLARACAGRVALRWETVGGWKSILWSSHPGGAIESYVPVRENGAVVAIVKLRHNLEPVMLASQRSLLVIVGLSAVAGLCIFSALTLLIRRADRVIRRQHADLARVQADLEERNRRLRDMEERKDKFYAALGHDLRSPLLSSDAGIRLALTDPGARLEDRPRDMLLDSSRSIEEVLALIGNLLDLASVEAGLDALETTPVDLNVLLSGVIATHRLLAEAHAVPIEVCLPRGPVTVQGDRGKLSRVFANLLSNAIKHAGRRPVRVTLEASPGWSRVAVEDEGPGVPAEHREAVFERFQRVPGAAESGAGLGLAIVREFVVRHGGSVTCESEPGVGSRFVVVLPLATPQPDRLAS